MNRVGTNNEANRATWLEATLRKVPAGARILDAGAGEQQYKPLCAHLVYVAQDFAQYDGQGDQTGLQMGAWDQSKLDIVCDITSIPELDASFDAVLCVEVLEHLSDPVAAIKEMSRLLRRGGQIILTAPFCSLTHFAPYHFYTGFNRYFYENTLSKHGFEILEMEENGNYFEYLAQEIRRLPSIASQYANDAPRRWEYWALRVVLDMLARFTTKDKNSAELLHFGYHVRALRK